MIGNNKNIAGMKQDEQYAKTECAQSPTQSILTMSEVHNGLSNTTMEASSIANHVEDIVSRLYGSEDEEVVLSEMVKQSTPYTVPEKFQRLDYDLQIEMKRIYKGLERIDKIIG